MSTRRSTRRTAASAEPAPSALALTSHNISSAVEPPRKKGRKSKAATPAAAPVESQAVTQSRSTKVSATSRATTASSTTTTAATVVSKRTTRAAKAAGQGSPLRVYEPPGKKRKHGRSQTTSATPEPTQSTPVQNDDEDDEEDNQGIFFTKSFDAQLREIPSPSPARPMFVSGSESAMALLKKIEKNAEEPRQDDHSVTEDGSSFSNPDVNMQSAPQPQSTKRSFDQSATPARPIVPSSFFTRSFSAIKNIRSLFSPAAPKAPSPPRAAPPPNTLTETLSAPPTPVGERSKTLTKGPKMDRLTRTLLKGIDPAEERKAEQWAKQIIPSLKNDKDFRQKRERLQTPVLLKDLNNFPSAKPWETGFGDPLADLDDEDVVPVWAVYLDMVADEEERMAKKHKSAHNNHMDFEDIPTIDEQFATSQGEHSSRRLFDSHGQSASNLDFHPRRSIVPSPMFDTSLSHHQGGNVFQELQGHDTAAKIRTDDREALQRKDGREAFQSATKTSQNHNPGSGSFSVPEDDSDEDNSSNSETADNVGSPATPVWTQAPPPAPVPAHAPLPGGAAADASTATSEKPVDEVERQRQKLMKHTPAKPSRLREATYPSPSLLSDAGNESILMATPAQAAAAMNSIFNSMPGAEEIELNAEEQAAFDDIVNSAAYKQQLAVPWAPAIISYDSDEEDLSPL